MPGKAALLQRLRREAEDIEKNFKEELKLDIVDAEKLIWHITFEGA